eukprot:281801-Amphidinium_carterae.1
MEKWANITFTIQSNFFIRVKILGTEGDAKELGYKSSWPSIPPANPLVMNDVDKFWDHWCHKSTGGKSR